MRWALAAIALLGIVGVGVADTLELKDGSLIEGKYLGGTQTSVRFQVGELIVTYPTHKVLALTFSGAPAAKPAAAPPAQPAQSAQPPPSVAAGQPAQPGQATPPPAGEPQAAPAKVVVPSGTVFRIRMQDTLDSRKHKAGHMFTTALEFDLTVGKKVVAKKGSLVYGKLVEAKKSGRLFGKSEMTITMTDLMINNKPHRIMASGIKAVTGGTGKNTAKNVAAGAAVGGIARGSKGARRGAAVGAGVSVLTSGNQINIPKGTLLEFRLVQPLSWSP